MDYKLTILLMIIGIMYHVMGEIKKLRKKFPILGFKQVWSTFFGQEWDSLMVSGLGVIVFELLLYAVRYNHVVLPLWIDSIGLYALAALWGYAGQRLAYKILNTSETVLEKKVEQITDSNG